MSDEDTEVTEDTDNQESISALQELNDQDDLCVICLSQLGEDDYSLDCNHKYHTKSSAPTLH